MPWATHGLKTQNLLKRECFEVEDHHQTTREETDAFKQKHGVETTPRTLIVGDRIGGYVLDHDALFVVDELEQQQDQPSPCADREHANDAPLKRENHEQREPSEQSRSPIQKSPLGLI